MLLYDRAILCLSTLHVFGVYYGYIPTRFKKKRGHLIIVHVFQHFLSNTKSNTNVRLCRFLCLFNLLPWKTTTLIYETASQCTWAMHWFQILFLWKTTVILTFPNLLPNTNPWTEYLLDAHLCIVYPCPVHNFPKHKGILKKMFTIERQLMCCTQVSECHFIALISHIGMITYDRTGFHTKRTSRSIIRTAPLCTWSGTGSHIK